MSGGCRCGPASFTGQTAADGKPRADESASLDRASQPAASDERGPLAGLLVAVRSVEHDLHVTELLQVRGEIADVAVTLDAHAEASVFPAAVFPDRQRVLVLRSSPGARGAGHTIDRLGVWRPWVAALGDDQRPREDAEGTGTVEWFGPAGGQIRNPALDRDGNFVVFESDRESFRDLYRVRVGSPGETELTRLTDDAQGNFEPAPSPDGQQLAFVSSRDGNPEIYRMGVRGDHPRRLTRDPASDGQPRWTPDGGRIVFVSSRDPKRGDDLFFMRPDGGEVEALLPARGVVRVDHLAWSPDGDHLAFTETRAEPGADEGERVTRVVVATYPGREIVLRTSGAGRDEWPAWTHDGRLLFSRSLGPDQARLMLVEPPKGDAVELTSDGVRWLPRWLAAAR